VPFYSARPMLNSRCIKTILSIDACLSLDNNTPCVLYYFYRPSEMRLLYFSTVGFYFILFFFQSPSRLELTSDCHNQYQYRKVVEVAVI